MTREEILESRVVMWRKTAGKLAIVTIVMSMCVFALALSNLMR